MRARVHTRHCEFVVVLRRTTFQLRVLHGLRFNDCCPRPEVAGWERNSCYFFSRLNLEKSERSYCALRGSCTSAGIIFFGKVISEVVSEWTCQLCARAEEEIKYSVSFVAKIFSIFFPHCPFAVPLFHFLCDQWYCNDIRLYSRIIEYNSVENNSPPLIIPCLASTLPWRSIFGSSRCLKIRLSRIFMRPRPAIIGSRTFLRPISRSLPDVSFQPKSNRWKRR